MTSTRFAIVRAVKRNRWELIDRQTKKCVAWSRTFQGALRAMGSIESPELDKVPMTGFRESLRVEQLAKVVAERVRRRSLI